MKKRPSRFSYDYVSLDGKKAVVFECPCCRLPTVTKPGGYEICNICHWEDDDTVEAGGANHCSLEEGQANFRSHQHMYSADHPLTTKRRRNEFLGTCIAILTDFMKQPDLKNRGILYAAFLVESEWI